MKTTLKKFSLWCLLLLVTVGALSAADVGIVTPPGSEAKEGDSSVGNAVLQERYQQVFDASYFSSLPPGGGWIRRIQFRSDAFPGAVAGTVIGTRISFSTTTKNADSLSPIFANNVGSDDKVFYSAGHSDLFFLAWQGSQSPQAFSGSFEADGSNSDGRFFYDPAKGNLLMDIQGFQVINLPHEQGLRFDSLTLPGHTSVRSQFGGGREQGILSAESLPVLFVVTPVPEPAGYALLVTGLVLFYRRPRTK